MTSIVPSPSIRASLAQKLRVYREQFEMHPEGLMYLESERGLSAEVASRFEIGYVAEPLPGDEWFQECISIPYLTPSGIVGIKYRHIGNGTPKYRKAAGEPNLLYNVNVLRTARKIVLTEGELDVVAATQAGLQAVGVPGAKSWKREWNRIFRNRQITVLCDGDQAGRELGERIANELYGARIVNLPSGQDVNSVLKSEGPEAIRERVLG